MKHVDAQEGELVEDEAYGGKFLGMRQRTKKLFKKKSVFHLAHHPRRKGRKKKIKWSLL